MIHYKCRMSAMGFLLAAVCLSTQAEVIVLGADQWCPYNCVPETEYPGYVVEVAREVFAKHNIQVKYINQPWSRVLRNVAMGDVNGAIAATKEELPNAVYPEEPMGLYRKEFFALNGSDWIYNGIESLDSQVVGVNQDYNYGDPLNQYIEDNKLKNVFVLKGGNLANRQLKMLMKKRTTVYLEDTNVVLFSAMNLNLKNNIKQVGESGDQFELKIGFSSKHPKSEYYSRILSEGITSIKASGRYKEILSRYGVVLSE
jgi:polar amino acid transport system substrate-binding protein